MAGGAGDTVAPAVTDVALLSNYQTRNLGNLALTRSVQRLLSRAYGADHLLALHRLPHPIADLVTRRDLDRWAEALWSQVGPPGDLPRPPAEVHGERVPRLATVAKEQATSSTTRDLAVRAAHSLPGLLLRARLDRGTGQTHLGALLAADDVVWNPGGEINTTSTPTTRLLEIEAALDQAKRVAMVNLSFEATPATRDFFRRRVSRFRWVMGRDEATVSTLIDLGADPERALLAPDAVFLVGSDLLPELAPPTTDTRRDAVGVVLHGLTAIDATRWARLVDAIRAQGSRIEILSSHKAVDGVVIRQLLDAAGADGVEVLPEFTEVGPYLAHLAGLRAVVTARFHTAVMGLVCGTTVAGVDTYGHKIAGGLTTAGFAGAVADGPDWPERAAAIVADGDRPDPADLDATRARVRDAWSRVFPLG